MIFRALDSSLDWTCGQGRQNYLAAEAAIELNVATRLRSFLNDCCWATDFGLDWWNLLGSKNPAAQSNVIVSVRASLAAAFGVVRINSVEAFTERASRRLTVRVNLDTFYSRGVVLSVQP